MCNSSTHLRIEREKRCFPESRSCSCPVLFTGRHFFLINCALFLFKKWRIVLDGFIYDIKGARTKLLGGYVVGINESL
jgi:hypothetical protein